jgi:zinc/manganese transport system substrate-binding protein
MQTRLILITLLRVTESSHLSLVRVAAIAAALGALVPLTGCGGESAGGDGEKIDVVATTTVVGDLVREVGGEAIEVEQILQPNSDPHDYEPRPSDVEAVAGAKLVFTSGRGLDDWSEELVSDSGGDAEIVDLGSMGPIRLTGEGGGSGLDPHWWHDPRNAEAAVLGIEKALAGADPSHRAKFARNANAYLTELKALDTGIARCIDSVPPPQRKLVTDHDAFGYFANRYGIEVVGAVIPSQTTQAQASARDLSELAQTIEDENVKAIFPESSLSADVVETIAAQTGATAEYTLYGDTLGPEGSDGDTYLRMEEANADAVVRGFTGGNRGCAVRP